MFVVVRSENPEASESIGQVVRLISEAGLNSSSFESGEHTIIGAEGKVPPGLKGRLERVAGVEEVVGNGGPALTHDLRVSNIRPLIPPAILHEQAPLSEAGAATVNRGRKEIVRILRGEDDRLLVVVGPCSIHDREAAMDYARRLKEFSASVEEDLCIIMRVYFEKPRTTVGWKGLINDPRLDDSYAVNEGLSLARSILLELSEMGLPAGCELLDPISPQFFSDAISWGAIGARTTESQVHRQLTSGLSMPVGFKNGTGGDLQLAVDAMGAATYPHSFLGVTEQGLAAIVTTEGNPDSHLILRGGSRGPNYDERSIGNALERLAANGLRPQVMVDTSHANSGKDYRRQPEVAREVSRQLSGGQSGITGVLLESFLEDGNQKLTDPADLTYGQSITDSCMGWEMTTPVLEEFAAAVRDRRG